MNGNYSLALVAVGLVLLVSPAFAPLDPVLEHDTRRSTWENGTVIEDDSYRVVAYENLSERGKELYVATLRNGGEYTVPVGEGAPEFAYPTDADLAAAESYPDRLEMSFVVVERPPDADLPPADERVSRAEDIKRRMEEREEETGEAPPGADMSVEEIRAQIARYDVMETRTTMPAPNSKPALLRLLPALLGVVAVGTGGYLSTKP